MSQTGDDIMLQYTEANRRAWNEIARIRHTQQPPTAANSTLDPLELAAGWRHFQGGEAAQQTKLGFSWPLGDIVTALAQAGHLYIERLEEFPAEQGWRFAVGAENVELHYLPGRFLLVARKGS